MGRLNYLVQLADSFGFDFGGEDGGIASFRNLGNAYTFAREVCKAQSRSTRVINTAKKGKVEYLLDPQAAV